MYSPTGQKLIRTAIQERVFAPAYLLYGEDDFLKEGMVREILDAALDPSTRDFNLEIRHGNDIDAETLGSLLDSPPLMADRRAIVIRDLPGLRKAARGVLDTYLQRPAADVLLLLVAPSGWKVDKQLGDRAIAVEFEPLTGARVPKWIAYYADRALQTSITPGATTLLQDAAGSNLAQLHVELEKLANYCSGRPIDEAAVTAVVGIQRGGTLADVLDAVARREPRSALAVLPSVLQQPKMSAVSIVMALATQTLGISWALARRNGGVSASRLSGELFALLKEAGSAFTGRSWTEAVATWSAAIDRWTSDDLAHALDLLLGADQSLKDTRVSSDDQLLTSLVLELCASAPRRPVA